MKASKQTFRSHFWLSSCSRQPRESAPPPQNRMGARRQSGPSAGGQQATAKVAEAKGKTKSTAKAAKVTEAKGKTKATAKETKATAKTKAVAKAKAAAAAKGKTRAKNGANGASRRVSRMGNILQWAPRMWQELDDFARHRLEHIFRAQTRLTTSYSGIGFFEMTYHRLKEHIAPKAPPLEVYSACDIDVHCQTVLRHMGGPSAAEHIFSNILDTISPADRARLDIIHGQFQAQVQANVEHGGMSKQAAVRQVDTGMLDSMDVVMKKAVFQKTAWCVKCGRECVLKPPPVSSDVLTGNAAGSVCVEFSSRGGQMGLVGAMVGLWLCWIYQRLAWADEEDFIFHECTRTHPTEFLMRRYLEETHWIWTFVVSPHMLSWPATRHRKMCMAVSKRFVLRSQSVPRSPAVLFKDSFVGNDSSIFWCEPNADEIEPLTAGDQRRLECFQAWVAEQRALGHEEWNGEAFYDISQSLKYCKKAQHHIGCLLTKTRWWSHEDERAMSAREALQVMGLPMLGPVAAAAGWKPDFGDAMDLMSPSRVRRFAGNGLHMPCVAALLLWCFGHAVEPPPESRWP